MPKTRSRHEDIKQGGPSALLPDEILSMIFSFSPPPDRKAAFWLGRAGSKAVQLVSFIADQTDLEFMLAERMRVFLKS